MTILAEAIENTPYEDKLPKAVEQYERYRQDLHILEGVVMYGRRLIVPTDLRSDVLKALHSAHQGVSKMSERTQQVVFWPRIYKDIEKKRAECEACTRNAPSQSPLPPTPVASPEYPFQMIVMDYCNVKGKAWLVIADRFTGWVSVYYFAKEATTQQLIELLRAYFSTFGVCIEVATDNGSQYRAKMFTDFLKRWGVERHRISSDYFPHSNLRAETAVKTAKRLLMNNTGSDGTRVWNKICRALLQHRNTPDQEWKLSPSQLLFGRPVRDFLPVKPGLFNPSKVWVDCREKRELAMRHRLSLGAERWSVGTRQLPDL